MLGMPHRGRLGLLTEVLQFPPTAMFHKVDNFLTVVPIPILIPIPILVPDSREFWVSWRSTRCRRRGDTFKWVIRSMHGALIPWKHAYLLNLSTPEISFIWSYHAHISCPSFSLFFLFCLPFPLPFPSLFFCNTHFASIYVSSYHPSSSLFFTSLLSSSPPPTSLHFLTPPSLFLSSPLLLFLFLTHVHSVFSRFRGERRPDATCKYAPQSFPSGGCQPCKHGEDPGQTAVPAGRTLLIRTLQLSLFQQWQQARIWEQGAQEEKYNTTL